MEETYELQMTLGEIYFLESCLRERQSSLVNHISLCHELELDSTASETNLAIVKSGLTKINEKLKEILYE